MTTLYTPAQKIAAETALAKITTMTPAERDRDNQLATAWLNEANREFTEDGKLGRADRIVTAASTTDKTFSEITNGVMPDGSQI